MSGDAAALPMAVGFGLVAAGALLARGRQRGARFTAGMALMAAGWVSCIWALGRGPAVIVLALMAVMSLLLAARALAGLRLRGRHRHRAGPSPVRTSRELPDGSPLPPPLQVEVVDATELPAAVAARAEVARVARGVGVVDLLRSIVMRQSALATRVRRRRRVLYLWVFEGVPEPMLVESLRRVGPVHLLRGASALSTMQGLGRQVLHPDDVVLSTEAEVADALDRLSDTARRGRHPLHGLVCNGDVWQFAVDQLLARSDAVVMDLAAYSSHRAGCTYELGLLVDRVATDRLVLRVDGADDVERVTGALAPLWATMALNSPNRAPGSRPRIVVAPDGPGVHQAVAELVGAPSGPGGRLPPPVAR